MSFYLKQVVTAPPNGDRVLSNLTSETVEGENLKVFRMFICCASYCIVFEIHLLVIRGEEKEY